MKKLYWEAFLPIRYSIRMTRRCLILFIILSITPYYEMSIATY